jgi:hypothetical protein
MCGVFMTTLATTTLEPRSDESVQVEEIAIVLQMLINMLNDIRDQLQRKWQLKSLCTTPILLCSLSGLMTEWL